MHSDCQDFIQHIRGPAALVMSGFENSVPEPDTSRRCYRFVARAGRFGLDVSRQLRHTDVSN
jgi:hypothetical protein